MNRLRFTAIRAEDVAGNVLGSDAPTAQQMHELLLRILQANVLGSIATTTAEGRAHINTVYFSYSEGLEVYFLSHPGSLHCRNVSINSSMAMAVFSSAQRWTEPDQGIQLFGVCEQASGPLADEAERSYADRFDGYAAWKASLKPDDPARQYRFFRFRATAVTLVDEKILGNAVFVRASIERE